MFTFDPPWIVPTFTVARTLDNPFLDRFLNRFREAKGQFIVDKQGSAGQIDDVLARGGKLVLLGDQHAGPKGCWVDFFGRQASCHLQSVIDRLSRRERATAKTIAQNFPGQEL